MRLTEHDLSRGHIQPELTSQHGSDAHTQLPAWSLHQRRQLYRRGPHTDLCSLAVLCCTVISEPLSREPQGACAAEGQRRVESRTEEGTSRAAAHHHLRLGQAAGQVVEVHGVVKGEEADLGALSAWRSLSRLSLMARQMIGSAPEVTATYDTSMTKKKRGGIGARTCSPRARH